MVDRKISTRRVDRGQLAKRLGVDPARVETPEFKELYPFASQLHHVPGGEMHYLDEGEGEPLVMVHGNPTWSFFYRDVVKAMRGKYRCLVPDHIGCGLSEKRANAETYTLERHIADLEVWLEAILPQGQAVNLMVHDWGGVIGLGYALRHPGRIKRLVVLNTSAFTEGDMPRLIKICRTPGLGRFLVRRLNLFCLGGLFLTTVRALPWPVRRGFVLPYNNYANRAAVQAFVDDIPLDRGTPTGQLLADIDSRLAGVLGGVPVLIQWGMRDWCFTPYFLDLWKKRFPRAEVDTYEAGHYLLEDAGSEIIPRVGAFLERPLP